MSMTISSTLLALLFGKPVRLPTVGCNIYTGPSHGRTAPTTVAVEIALRMAACRRSGGDSMSMREATRSVPARSRCR
jgi:hypothetical protein